jgi:hypothetical protein
VPGRLLADRPARVRAAHERGRVLVDDRLTRRLVGGLDLDHDRDAGRARLEADRGGAVDERHPRLDRPVQEQVLLAVEDHPEQLHRDHLHRRRPQRRERGHEREHRRREVAGGVLRDVVVGGGGVRGQALARDLELLRVRPVADLVGVEVRGHRSSR